MFKKIFVGACTLLLVALFAAGPQITWAAYNFPSAIGQFTGDCTTASPNTYATTCTKTNGTAFGTAATQNTGTSGANIPLMNGANTWSATQTFAGIAPTSVTSSGAVSGTAITGTSLSAGSGAVTGGAGTFTSAVTSAGQVVAYRALTSGTTTALVAGDQFVCINKTTGSATAVTQTALTVGQIFHVKDCKGDAATNNITYTPGSGITVDGSSSVVLNNAYQEINLVVTSATTVSVF